MDKMLRRKRQAVRRTRRYARLAASKLPNWVPAALAEALASNFSDVARTRQDKRYSMFEVHQHPDCADQYCVHCRSYERQLKLLEDERAWLMRLAADNLNLRNAWNAIKTNKLNGPRGASLPPGADPEIVCHSLLQEIKHQFGAGFPAIPRQSAAETKKAASKIATLARKLIDALDEHQGGSELASEALCGYLAVRNLDHRLGIGETISPLPPDLPPRTWPLFSYAPTPTESGYGALVEESVDELPWDKRAAVERLRWLCDEINRTDLRDLLHIVAKKIEQDAKKPAQVSRPGSGNPRVRVLASALSDWMRDWYGSPLDDVVACLVTAALDLPGPLDRDWIRPIVKRASGT
ncbi:hypothetical protein [Burkholderia seminalis]|uniref:hypothetical protein n=1 Tax=Burkholderia seminalis TaxID=488731 RepID=UPI000AE1A66E|nr:hypothetical protein [Burkholderia seminalis]